MFGWRKREQGFEWHNYVRTTIKLRREARREKAEQIKQHAADGVKAAGAAAADGVRAASAAAAGGVKAAGAAAADGLNAARAAAAEGAKVAGAAAGVAARQGAQKLGAGSRAAAQQVGRGLGALAATLGPRLDAAASRLVTAAQPALEILGRRQVQAPLIIVGALLAASGIGRSIILQGTDGQASVAIAIGTAALALGVLPRLLLATAPPLPGWLGAGVRRPVWAALAVIGVLVLALARLFSGSGPLLGAGSWPQLPFSGPPETIQGRVAGVTGDVMRMGTQGVRLADVEFPDREQTCTRPGKKPLTWRCGDVAYAAFARLVGNRTLSCEVRSRDSQGNALALCREGATVVNEELVRNGHVFAVPGLLSRYSTLEADAQARKVGVWSGEAVRPDKWRQRKWDEAQKRNPDRCPIKGKIIGNAKTYVLPWSPNYDGLKVNPKLGERWFCSEQEAIDAGWKTAGR